jgi:hypothetical protein
MVISMKRGSDRQVYYFVTPEKSEWLGRRLVLNVFQNDVRRGLPSINVQKVVFNPCGNVETLERATHEYNVL